MTARAASDERAGLCARCAHARVQASAKRSGSTFTRCARADDDARFARYPPLPVRACAGFEVEHRLPEGGAREPDGTDVV